MFDPQHLLTPQQLNRLVSDAGQAPFVSQVLAVDPPLWGGFWYSDVISAGYALPALELALLRGMRLDRSWPAGIDPAQFLADLQAAALQPQAGVWSLSLVGRPLAVFATPLEISAPPAEAAALAGLSRISTVIWYGLASGCLHAGYRAPVTKDHFTGMVCQQRPGFQLAAAPAAPPVWLSEAVEQRRADEQSDASRLDTAILHWRYNRP